MEEKDYKLSQQPILTIDSTPDKEYVLRILKAYRENCNCKFCSNTDGDVSELNPVFALMNEHNDERAKLLDDAIRVVVDRIYGMEIQKSQSQKSCNCCG